MKRSASRKLDHIVYLVLGSTALNLDGTSSKGTIKSLEVSGYLLDVTLDFKGVVIVGAADGADLKIVRNWGRSGIDESLILKMSVPNAVL